MFASIKENCANNITVVLSGIFGLALFSGIAKAVTCTPTGAAAAEASVTFNVPFNLCGVSTNAPVTAVENTFVFKSFLPSGSGTVVEGARIYSAIANAPGTLDIFELNGITMPFDTVTSQFTGVFPAVLVGTFPDFGTFRMDLLLVVAGPDITVSSATVSAIPIPAAALLFGSGLLGLVGIARRKRA
jgi:hypothetical protein